MGKNGISKPFLFAATFGLVAYCYLKWSNFNAGDLNAIEYKISEVWSSSIKWPDKKFTRLAVGTNANVDLIVPGVKVLYSLGLNASVEKNHNLLNSLSDLEETFTYFFRRGRAAERIFTNPEVFKQLVAAATSLGVVEQYVGGNAALMAKKASSLFPDVEIQFVGPVGPTLQQLMPQKIIIPKTSFVQDDEVHLIMEYKVGQMFGSLKAPVANRFICSYDAANSKMKMLETFFASLSDFKPEVVLLSGLHMLDGESTKFFSSRVDALVTGLRKIDRSIPVHLEFASMANKEFVKTILSKVLPEITSLGLNEQELAFASIAAGGPHSDHIEDSQGQPLIHKMSDIIHWLLYNYGKSTKNPNSRLSRIHFHSLTYHIVGVHRSQWKNVRSATMAGTRLAGMQACDVQKLDPDIVDLKMPLEFQLFSGDVKRTLDPESPAHSWSINEYLFVLSPVLVCKDPVKTVGLGDAISATGLMFSEFIRLSP